MVFSPARAHKTKIAAEQVANATADSPVQDGDYQIALANMDQQRRSLKSVQSMETKQAMKADYLQEWQPYIDATLAENSGANDSIISRLWIWLLDTGDVDQAIDVGRYLLEHDLPTPEGFTRTTATAFAEEIAGVWLTQSAEINSAQLLDVSDLTAAYDMHDEVRAKLHRAVGESLADSDPANAVVHLDRAIELNDRVGCKKQLDALKKQLEKAKPD